MCLIVDANVMTLVFSVAPHADFAPVWDAIRNGNAVAVYGGQLAREYGTNRDVAALVRVLLSQGKVRLLPLEAIEEATERFRSNPNLRSDDPHILAIADVGSVRLLCSRDENLHSDFRNPRLLANPRGSVYSSADHAHLIRRHCKPPVRKKKRK